ncbi:MAG: folate-binding protein YgfZ [Bradymonadia bacterium]|jgi:folate-binding protein YgfZ
MHVFDPDHLLFALHGADAPDFLNRLLTLDMRGLPVGTASRGFLLDARGKIVLALRLFRVAEDTFWTDRAAHEVEHMRDRLDMFHFAERFAVTPVTTHHVVWTTTANPNGMPEGAWAVPSDRCGPGWDLYVPHGTPVPGQTADTAWRTARRVEHASPAWPFEYRSDATPLDVGKTGITEGKGCYPGQEVIERTLALGRPARRLVRVVASEPVAPGPLLSDDGAKPAGELTSVAGTRGLAMIKYTRTGPFLREGVPVRIDEGDAI